VIREPRLPSLWQLSQRARSKFNSLGTVNLSPLSQNQDRPLLGLRPVCAALRRLLAYATYFSLEKKLQPLQGRLRTLKEAARKKNPDSMRDQARGSGLRGRTHPQESRKVSHIDMSTQLGDTTERVDAAKAWTRTKRVNMLPISSRASEDCSTLSRYVNEALVVAEVRSLRTQTLESDFRS